MHLFRAIVLIFILLFADISRVRGQVPTNTFRTHLNYTSVRGITQTPRYIYVYTTNGFFRKDRNSTNFQYLDKRNGLSSMNVTATHYDTAKNQLLVGYQSGRIDLVMLDAEGSFTEIKTIDFIEKSTAIQSSKSINNIITLEQKAYVATAFGLVELDLETQNISETYRNIGPNGQQVSVSDIKIKNDSIFVATPLGVLGGSLSPNVNLLFFGNWNVIPNSNLFDLPAIPPDAPLVTTVNVIINDADSFWIGDASNGMITNDLGGWYSLNPAGLPETSGYFYGENERIGFVGNKGYVFEENRWNEIQPPFPAKQNIIIDRFENRWERMNNMISVTSNGRTLNFSQFNGLSGQPTDIALSRDDLLWITTTNGVTVIPTANDFANNPTQPFTPVFENQRLLLQQLVNTVVIDGGNRKWFGTNRGLYCFSPETDKLIHFFDTKNSLLLDNQIIDLAVNPTGELFILSQNGVISYQTAAAEPEESLNNLSLFPNPIRPDFEGVFTVKGLSFDSNIKITSPDGRVVYTGFSNGGIATWDLRTPNGEKAPSGVYFVFILNADFTEKFVGKVAIIR